jgi:hypothetical protein
MLASGYLGSEHAKSRQILDGHDRLRRASQDPEGIARFVSVNAFGGTLRLPLPRLQFFPDTLDAAQAVRSGRAPLAASGGFQWQAVRDFLASDGSPLFYRDQLPGLLDAWRAAGIVEVRVDTGAYEDQAVGQQLVDGIRAAEGRILSERPLGRVTSFALVPLNLPLPRPAAPLFQVPDRALTLTSSHGSDRLPLLVDGDRGSRWLTGVPQHGGEWIRIRFDRPRHVARLRLELARRSYGDYPRGLRVESESQGRRVLLYDGSVLPPLVAGLLREPIAAPADIDLPANQSEALVITQTGQSRVWFWSIHSIAVWAVDR